MTSYNGQSITYDEIGNPLTYAGMSFTWEKGRRLSQITDGENTYSYTYNADGIRTSKTVNGVRIDYVLEGDRIVYQKYSTGEEIWYNYDAAGKLLGFHRRTAEGLTGNYYYIRNGQGDILGFHNQSGRVVVRYTYDAWGKVISISGSMAGTLGKMNPFRYRGYYYDEETELYYLNSRYYNPDWGRFVNGDTTEILNKESENTVQYNLYAYCWNNPISMSDDIGYWPEWVSKAIAVVAVATILVAATAVTVATCGAGSIAGVAMISATVTIAARTTEVAVLQAKKGKKEKKSNKQIAKDSVESVFNNAGKIFGATPVTKTSGVAFNYYLNSQISTLFNEKHTFTDTLKSTGGKFVPYAFSAYAWSQTLCSIFSRDVFKRADQRGYVLK